LQRWPILFAALQHIRFVSKIVSSNILWNLKPHHIWFLLY
jgi:hypothetical protein